EIGAWRDVGGRPLEPEHELRIGDDRLHRHADARLEVAIQPARAIQLHQAVHVAGVDRAAIRVPGQRGNHFPRAGDLVGRSSWAADENLATAGRVADAGRL